MAVSRNALALAALLTAAGVAPRAVPAGDATPGTPVNAAAGRQRDQGTALPPGQPLLERHCLSLRPGCHEALLVELGTCHCNGMLDSCLVDRR
jgi:hypothetical protein